MPFKTNTFTLTACAVFFGLSAHATTVLFNDFSSTAGLQLNGNAAAPVATGDGNVLRLTPSAFNQSGSAFSQNQISLQNNASFSTFFTFRISHPGGIGDADGQGADGIVFAVQTVANNVGGSGGGLGYAGILSSVGVEFDTYNNGGGDGNDGNHLGVDLNGSVNSVARQNIATRFNDGNIWYSWIDYDGISQDLSVRVSQSPNRPATADLTYNVDLAGAAVLGQTSAFVGFTSGTGSGFNDHDILAWEFRDTFNPISGVPDSSPTIGLLAFAMALFAGARRSFRQF